MTALPVEGFRASLGWVAIVAAVVTGCGSNSVNSHEGSSATSMSQGPISATAPATGKPGPPIDLELSVPSLPTAGVSTVPVLLSVTTQRPVATATADVSVSGPLSIVGNHGGRWEALGANTRRTLEGSIRIEGVGHGEIRGTVIVTLSPEADGQGRIAVLYLLATGDEVLVGSDGPTALELRHLDHLRTKQHLSNSEYLRRRDQIISGR